MALWVNPVWRATFLVLQPRYFTSRTASLRSLGIWGLLVYMAWIVLLGEVIPSYWDITKKLTSNRKSDILSHSIDCTVQLTLTIVCVPYRPREEGEKLMSGDKKDVEGAPEEVVDLSKLEVSAKASQVLAT